MTWKHEIQLRDLENNQSIEIICRSCSRTYYEQTSTLLKQDKTTHYTYLNEVEKLLHCKYRGCHGSVKIVLTSNIETEGFVGGLP